MSSDKSMKRVRANWADVILVCRKCSRKLDGGFGNKGDESLAKLLRKTLGSGMAGGKTKGRKAALGVIDVDCLDICPKNAVVVLRAGAPQDWAVIPRGTPLAAIIDRLGLDSLALDRPRQESSALDR